MNFSNYLVVAIENSNHESSKLRKVKNYRSSKKSKAKRSKEIATSKMSPLGLSLLSL